jgi:hypothetical protein
MKAIGRQQGLTMWGISLIILIGVFFLFLFFKLFPAYLEDAQVSSAISSFAASPDSANLAPSQAVENIQKRFDIDSVRNVSARDIKVIPEGSGYAVEVAYEVEVEMFGNVTVLLDFDHRATIR